VYLLGSVEQLPIAPLLAMTAGFFIYIAASDVIPDIHEQKRRIGMIQAAALTVGIIFVGGLVTYLHEVGAHTHEETGTHLEETHHDETHDEK